MLTRKLATVNALTTAAVAQSLELVSTPGFLNQFYSNKARMLILTALLWCFSTDNSAIDMASLSDGEMPTMSC
jgi:hypothetical protein